MRQVPGRSPIGIVGDGRVATHFLHYFQLLRLPVRSWSRRRATTGPDEGLAGCDPVLLLLNDRAIPLLIQVWPALTAHRLVHCSGALVTPVAEAAQEQVGEPARPHEAASSCDAERSRAAATSGSVGPLP